MLDKNRKIIPSKNSSLEVLVIFTYFWKEGLQYGCQMQKICHKDVGHLLHSKKIIKIIIGIENNFQIFIFGKTAIFQKCDLFKFTLSF